MSTERVASLPQAAKGLCRGCGKPVGKGRRSWCSQSCVDAALIKLSPSVARWRVHERDKGICAKCGADADMVERMINRARAGIYQHFTDTAAFLIVTLYNAWGAKWATYHSHHHLWEADHILPVVEGGGACELDNYRTLCVPCHREETKALASRRAQRNRDAKYQERLQRWNPTA